ncbi:hypothetical protein E2C01_098727 [Portunus trituberculatus]|uniref:Uncharacterized protein n=1 Tax=Portunus trituberculatus TaxID=210409 RepID=A0A5B7K944_PORTR|nr:hypothetical protein [Portunus trituberculatus]
MDKVQAKAKVCSQVGGLRPLLVAMVVGGNLYHTRDKTHSPPLERISPPLAIWAAILNLCILSLDAVRFLGFQYCKGSILLDITNLSYAVTTCFYCIVVVARSRRLARLLNHLEDIDYYLTGLQERRPRVLRDPSTVINMMALVILNVSVINFVTDMSSVVDVVHSGLVMFNILVTSSLFRAIFRLLAWNLQHILAESRMSSHVVGGSRGLDVHRLQAVCLRVSAVVWVAGTAAWQANITTHFPGKEELFLYSDL